MDLLIDLDSLIYGAALGCQKVTKWRHDCYTYTASLSEAVAGIGVALASLEEEVEKHHHVDEYVCFLSDPELRRNWRLNVLPEYKSHRSSGIRPLLYTPLRQWAERELGAEWVAGFEGDDLLGLASGPGRIIASIDKDMRTIPGLHFNPDRPDDGVVEVTPEQAWRFHLLQTLMGDRVDGYPGCPGVGAVKARRLLDKAATPAEAWDLVVAAYCKALGDVEGPKAALANARVARILQPGDVDDKMEVILWNPTKESE